MQGMDLLVIIGSLLLIRQAYLIFYRIHLHPLSLFPGPRLAAISRLYEFYHDYFVGIGCQFYLKLDQLHEEYGRS